MRLKRILYSVIIVLSRVGREVQAARKSDMAPMPNLSWFEYSTFCLIGMGRVLESL